MSFFPLQIFAIWDFLPHMTLNISESHKLISVYYADCQKNNGKEARKGSANVSRVTPSIGEQMQQLPADSKTKVAQESVKTELKSSKVECSMNCENTITCQTGITVKAHADNPQTRKQNKEVPSQLQNFSKRGYLLFRFLISEHNIFY